MLRPFRNRKVAAPLKRKFYETGITRVYGLPQPKGCGPIEAIPAASIRRHVGPFRNRKVAAPLKPFACSSLLTLAERSFRNRKVAAPLKPGADRQGPWPRGTFRNRKVAAPLKQCLSGFWIVR